MASALENYSNAVIILLIASVTQIQGVCIPCPDKNMFTELSACKNCSDGLFFDFQTKECVRFNECAILKKLTTTKLSDILGELVSKYNETVADSPTNEFVAKDKRIIKKLVEKHMNNYVREVQSTILGIAMPVFMKNRKKVDGCKKDKACLAVNVLTDPKFTQQAYWQWDIIQNKFVKHLKLLFDDLELASVNCLSDQQCPILMNIYKARRYIPNALIHSWDLIKGILTEMEVVEEDLYENNQSQEIITTNN